jgi:N-acetylmuramoyl-L-alanine amidase
MPIKTEIIVHCSDTYRDWWKDHSTASKVREVTRWHVVHRGWRGNAYAYLIDIDGTRAKGRDLDGDGNVDEEIGAHTVGFNTNSIGIMLFGGHGSAADDRFEDHFTPEQDKALRELIDELLAKYPSIKGVSGHNQYAPKACPGFNVPLWWTGKDVYRPTADDGVLRLGDRGQAVREMQKKLGVEADGIFGPITAQAVRTFQEENGLTIDGIAGPQTLKKSRPTADDGVLRLGDRGEDVKALQRRLIETGWLDDVADGIFGPKTEAAVKAFQTYKKLTVDGIAGPQTLNARTK